MKTTIRLLAAAVFALALPLTASAQTTPPTTPAPKLDVGKWTGTVAPSGQDPIDLEFTVSMAGDTLKIDLSIPVAGLVTPLNNIKLDGAKLDFGFMAGPTDVKCNLVKKDDGSYAGPCADANGQGGPMTMIPPKKGDAVGK